MLILLGIVSLLISLLLTPIFRGLFLLFGFVDHPDATRKLHRRPIPNAGGTSIVFSYVASFFIVHAAGHIDLHLALAFKIFPAASVVFLVGIVDDLWGLKPLQKLMGQFISAAIACWSGILIFDIAGVHGHSWWSVPVTILWLLACSNAFNLVDGMDGLAAGVGLFATTTTFVAAVLQHNVPLAMVTVSLAGCLLGFLRYNFNPATVFLGDSGSLVIGFLLGCYSIIWVQKSATLLGITAPLIAFSIPLFDATLAIGRRFLRTQPIFSADRGHIHHRLLDRGMSPRKAVLVLYGMSGLLSIFSLLQTSSHNNQIASIVVLAFCAVVWLAIQYLGYIEFTLAGHHLFRGGLRRSVKLQIDLKALEQTLVSARDLDESARVSAEWAHRFGFQIAEMQLRGRVFKQADHKPCGDWEIRIPLEGDDFVFLVSDSTDQAAVAAAGSFIRLLCDSLRKKAASFAEVRTVESASKVLHLRPYTFTVPAKHP